jgi:hypothetical protein
LLRGSFVAPAPLRKLRELTRARRQLIDMHSEEANRVQKVLETANIKLGDVATDVLGVSGRAMLKVLIAGERDPVRCRNSIRLTPHARIHVQAHPNVAPLHSHWLCARPPLDRRPTIWRRELQAAMRPMAVVQLDNVSLIVLRFAKFVIGGIHGSVGPPRCTRR